MKRIDKIQTAVFLLGAVSVAYLSSEDPRQPLEESRAKVQQNVEMQESDKEAKVVENTTISVSCSLSMD